MKKLQINGKELFKGISIICLYFLLSNILAIPFVFLIQKKLIGYNYATLLLYYFLALIFFFIYIKDMIKDFEDFKKNFKSILKTTFNYWIKGLFIMFISSYIITLLNLDANVNQAANEEMLMEMPVVQSICAILLAPMLEELVFRRSLKNFTNNKHLYAITTGLIFGLIHVTSSITSISDLPMLIYLIPYGSVGIAFGYAYKKTNNIYGTMVIHGIHNAISISIMILGGLL